jgi:hypothetical protein
MASKPWFSASRGRWLMKYRPDPTGPWKIQPLGKHPEPFPPSRPPKKPPQVILDRAHEFEEIEYRAKHNLGAAPARLKGLEVYLHAYVEAYEGTRRKGSVKQLRRHVARFLRFAAARGITSVQSITRAVCRDYLEARIKQVAHGTLRTERGYLIGIWTRAVEDNLVAANPWQFAKVPGKPAESEPTFWTAEEIGTSSSAGAPRSIPSSCSQTRSGAAGWSPTTRRGPRLSARSGRQGYSPGLLTTSAIPTHGT